LWVQKITNLVEKLCIIFISPYYKDRIGKRRRNSMATTTVINKDNDNNNNKSSNNKEEKTVLEQLQDISIEYSDLYAAFANEDPSLIK
jgi:hypothetical protein